MKKDNAKHIASLAIVIAGVLGICTGLASAFGPSTTGEAHLYEADANAAGTIGTIVLTGAVTDWGTDEHGSNGTNTFVLQKGSFAVDATAAENKLGRVANDLTTCSFNATVHAPLRIVPGSGTGIYSGITGTFKAEVSEADVFVRFPDGTCNTDDTLMHGVLIGNGSGTVSYTHNH